MKARRIFTGSAETESEIALFLSVVESLDDPAPRSLFKDEYMFKVMTTGRNGKGDAYEGSQASDDVGGFFEVQGDQVFLTQKAKDCVSI